MIELVFTKTEYCYQSLIDLGGDDALIELDTGSPISTISIPNLLQITGESLLSFRKKVNTFTGSNNPLSLGVYGSQMNSVKHDFIPYLIKKLKIGETKFPYFLFLGGHHQS